MKKSARLYWCLMLVWLALCAAFIPTFLDEFNYIEATGLQKILVTALLIQNGIFILYFWLNGAKDVVYVIYYYTHKNKLHQNMTVPESVASLPNARVALVYCTCNDFEASSLEKCMRQTHANTYTVILDDSDDEKYKRKIDEFANQNEVRVIRRNNRIGYKAGNLNNYLRQAIKGMDYFVILDSDEIIPNNFCEEALRYFNYFRNVGIVQGNHIATRNRTKFMKIFHVGVESHWLTYQTTKAKCGFMSLLGHGAMVSRECYEAAGGVPEMVAEDLCFSIEARCKGYYTAFAPNIVCEEEYPVDYIAFKKRHNKWTQGNLEFIKKYTGRILRSKMSWYEKMDIVLFTYNLPLTVFFSFYIFINVIFLPVLGHQLHYPVWLLVPTVIFFLAPMANDFISWIRRMGPVKMVKYMLMTFVLYGSMLYTSIKASALGLVRKKAVFLVTPKNTQRVSLLDAILQNYQDLAFAVVMTVLSVGFCGSVLPVILIVAPAVLSVMLSMYANGAVKEELPATVTSGVAVPGVMTPNMATASSVIAPSVGTTSNVMTSNMVAASSAATSSAIAQNVSWGGVSLTGGLVSNVDANSGSLRQLVHEDFYLRVAACSLAACLIGELAIFVVVVAVL